MCADIQEVADRSELVTIAVRRQDHHEVVAGLQVDGAKAGVNLMAGATTAELHRTPATGAPTA